MYGANFLLVGFGYTCLKPSAKYHAVFGHGHVVFGHMVLGIHQLVFHTMHCGLSKQQDARIFPLPATQIHLIHTKDSRGVGL